MSLFVLDTDTLSWDGHTAERIVESLMQAGGNHE